MQRLIDHRTNAVVETWDEEWVNNPIAWAIEGTKPSINHLTVILQDGTRKTAMAYLERLYPQGYVRMVKQWATENGLEDESFSRQNDAWADSYDQAPEWYTRLHKRLAQEEHDRWLAGLPKPQPAPEPQCPPTKLSDCEMHDHYKYAVLQVVTGATYPASHDIFADLWY